MFIYCTGGLYLNKGVNMKINLRQVLALLQTTEVAECKASNIFFSGIKCMTSMALYSDDN